MAGQRLAHGVCHAAVFQSFKVLMALFLMSALQQQIEASSLKNLHLYQMHRQLLTSDRGLSPPAPTSPTQVSCKNSSLGNTLGGSGTSGSLPWISGTPPCQHRDWATGFMLGGATTLTVLAIASLTAGCCLHYRRRQMHGGDASPQTPKQPLVAEVASFRGIRVEMPGDVDTTHLAWPDSSDPEGSKTRRPQSPDSTVHSLHGSNQALQALELSELELKVADLAAQDLLEGDKTRNAFKSADTKGVKEGVEHGWVAVNLIGEKGSEADSEKNGDKDQDQAKGEGQVLEKLREGGSENLQKSTDGGRPEVGELDSDDVELRT